ncbi:MULTISPECIES: helix-turn-helix domain-containing protein [Amycolatopsis]|uniref:Helix-turn-helix protein n=2 Tax=Amycolatopsis TaxID=1813 RepID=A0A2N3WF87_9PSEU|nr:MULTISPECIES: helix-turn-helix transcriptional regulator [Amycolatopsis]MBB2505560.1 helix-turn-helix transcriptional regulator [Amycolatopsis echigonensis]PKV92491.1 helix-turn-helix protein [Amycolatopsis niigatensis]TVT20304.1 helix-turn-helix transcriptional regulator [Amycolatopsis acidiphila]UIJ59680.1 helix-turn-helix domain-containing protein [Amycolatopsis acidiphila]GHG81307.1 transcriptional regulator [Amycolatopsis acidiphila]
MSDHLAHVVGERIRFYRTTARRTKAVVAGLAGITPDYLYQIERGQKVPTLAVLAELATVLHVDLGELLGVVPPPPRQHTDSAAADALYRALVSPATPVPGFRGNDEVRRAVLDAWRTWQTSPHRYTALTAQLPTLIGETEAALRGADAAGSRAAHRSAADLYCLVRTVTKRVGRGDLSLLVADRAVRAAEEADDPVRLAGVRWNLTQVLLADGQTEGAEAVAMHAVDELRPFRANGNLDALAVSGALLLIAAIAAVRNGDAWGARDRLRLASPLAEKTGERNTCWTAFGPTNVAMYAVSIELESGEAAEGLRLAERIEPQHSPSIERRVAFLLDQAKGYQQRRDYARSLRLLETAASEAAEDMQFRPTAHKLLRTTIERGQRSVSAEASRLAGQIGLPF